MGQRDAYALGKLVGWFLLIAIPVRLVMLAIDWYETLPLAAQILVPVVLAALAALAILQAVQRHRVAREARRAWEIEQDRLEREAYARQQVMDRQIAYADTLTGTQFEHLVARLLNDAGWSAHVQGGAGDLGMDIAAHDPAGRKLVVQCKRYGAQAVGSKDMQAFLGTHREIHGADLSAFVTTSRFTKAAADLGQRTGIVLIDRARLAAWMADGVPAALAPTGPAATPAATALRPGPDRANPSPVAHRPPLVAPTRWGLGGDWVNIVIDRHMIEDFADQDLWDLLERLEKPGASLAYQGRVSLHVAGYDDDPRELYEIPDAAGYLEALAEAIPWAHYLPANDPMLHLMAYCAAGARSAGPGQVHVDAALVSTALERYRRAAAEHAATLGLTPTPAPRLPASIVN